MKRGLIIFGIIGMAAGLTWYIRRQIRLLGDYCFEMKGHRVTYLRLQRTVVEVDLEVLNRSDIDVKIDSYAFNVSVNGTMVSRVLSKGPRTLTAKGKTILTLIIDFDPRVVLKRALTVDMLTGITKGDLTISLDGTVSVSHAGIKAKNVPVKLTKKLKDMVAGAPTKCEL